MDATFVLGDDLVLGALFIWDDAVELPKPTHAPRKRHNSSWKFDHIEAEKVDKERRMQEKREKNDYIINEKMREQRGRDIMVGA